MNLFSGIKEMVPVVFYIYTKVKQLLGCESDFVCQSAKLPSNCSEFYDTGKHFDMSFGSENLTKHSKSLMFTKCMDMLQEMKLSVQRLEKQLPDYQRQTEELHEVLMSFLLFLEGMESNEKFDVCFFLIEEALNVTNNARSMLSLLSEICVSQNLSIYLEMTEKLLYFITQQPHIRKDTTKWANDWEQMCGSALEFRKHVKYEIISGREMVLSCRNIFIKVGYSIEMIQAYPENLFKQASIIEHVAQITNKYLQQDITKFLLNESFTNQNFGLHLSQLRFIHPVIEGHNTDLKESAIAAQTCFTEALGKFLRMPVLPLAWEVISKLEIIKELQNQSTSSPVVLTQDNIFDISADLINRYFSEVKDKVAFSIKNVCWDLKYLVHDVDKVKALLQDYSAQTKMDDSYFM